MSVYNGAARLDRETVVHVEALGFDAVVVQQDRPVGQDPIAVEAEQSDVWDAWHGVLRMEVYRERPPQSEAKKVKMS